MRLHILSDLHLEFADFTPPDTDADVIVLAGDIDIGLAGIQWAKRIFPEVPVVYVPGNHEYYDLDISFVRRLKEQAPDNVHVLDNDSIVIDGVRFLGCTLWTDFKLFGEGDTWFAMQRAKQSIEDFSTIRKGGRIFTPQDSVELHEESKGWLEAELKESFNGPTVVVTHHLPATKSVAQQYATDPLSPTFASKLENLIEAHQPELWVHGHTHVPCDYTLFETRVVCNSRGYPGERREPIFRDDLIVTVGSARSTSLA